MNDQPSVMSSDMMKSETQLPHPKKSFAQFWKRLDSHQKTGMVAIALVALTLPLGTIAAMREVRQRSQAYLPITPPVTPPTTPPPSYSERSSTYLRLENENFNDTYLETAPVAPLNTTPFTVETWVKVFKPSSGDYLRDYALLTYTKPQSPADYGYLFKLSLETQESNGESRAIFSILKAGSGYMSIGSLASKSIESNKWTHVAITGYSQNEICYLNLFINGFLAESTSQYAPNCKFSTQNPQKLTIGKNAPGTSGISGYYYHGALDDVRISKVIRYENDFIPQPVFDTVDANTLLLLNFSENITDSSPFQSPLTMIGSHYGYTSAPTTSPTPFPTPSTTPTAPPSPTATPQSCANTIHTVSMTPTTQSSIAGGTLTYNAVITNRNTGSCGASYFTASSQLPNLDWSATFSPPTPLIGPGESKTIIATFTSSKTTPIRTEGYPVAIKVAGPLGTVSAVSNYQVVLNPSPSPTTSPTATPILVTPKPTSLPTPRPTVKPSPKPNANPIILTRSLPAGIKNRKYSALITAYDPNSDPIAISVSGLPKGLKTEGCSGSRFLFIKMAQCRITGTPNQVGAYAVSALATDNRGGKTSQKFTLKIR